MLCMCGRSWTGVCFVLVHNSEPEGLASCLGHSFASAFPQKQRVTLCLGCGSGRVSYHPQWLNGFCTRDGSGGDGGWVLSQPCSSSLHRFSTKVWGECSSGPLPCPAPNCLCEHPVETLGKELASDCRCPLCRELPVILNCPTSPHLTFKNPLTF